LSDSQHPALSRSVGLIGAVGIGLASMIGAGAFVVWAPAAAAAGELMFIALVVAGVIATLNAFSSAQLAMAFPVSGGAYSFGRRWVGPWTGFTAGWLFLVGKTASAAAIASVAAAYLGGAVGLDAGASRVLAAGLIVVFAGLNISGVRTTARVSVVIVSVVLAGLTLWLVLVVTGAGAGAGAPSGGFGAGGDAVAGIPNTETAPLVGVLQAAALLFFAFAGYARMATLGEEVHEPRRTLPRAILLALAAVLGLYAVIALALVSTLGVGRLARSSSPLADALDPSWALPIALLAALACFGSLMGILAGLSRTALAMARESDLPGPFARISPRTSTPIAAEIIIAALAVLIALLLEPAQLVAASSAAVLVYYAIAHASALRQSPSERWQPRVVATAGLAGCLVLVASLPMVSLLGTAGILAVGLAARAIALRFGRQNRH
jgi:basic amino acid/polyamine antiporter, APA family